MPREESSVRDGICRTRRERPESGARAHAAAVEALTVMGLGGNSTVPGGEGETPHMDSSVVISCRVRAALPSCAECRSKDKTRQAESTIRARS